jgi:CRP/FNR family transcriptional regulator, cyclic AMP receptor protein
LFREGDQTDSVWLLESGLVKLTHAVGSHRRTIVRLVRPGQLIGERLVDRQRHAAEALIDCEHWVIPRVQFRKACDSSPAALAWVASQVEERLREVELRVELITFARVEVRLLSLLADLAGSPMPAPIPPSDGIQIPLSQAEIAQLIGATRETASTTLNQFERRGLLRLGRRQIEVLSIDALRAALKEPDNRATSAHA